MFCAFPMQLLKILYFMWWNFSVDIEFGGSGVVATFVVTFSSGVKVHNVLCIANATAQNNALYVVKLFGGDGVLRFRLSSQL